MDATLTIVSPATVRALIAHIILGSERDEPALGSIQLQPHQASVLARLTSSLREAGGALLCDEVGMGKTFVALAVARQFEHRLVVAPAGLERMWRDALARAEVTAEFTTYERLSRNDPSWSSYDLLILDEAHHARNPTSRRYQRIACLARGARILMLTATPVHNRRADLIALLSLFLGSRAKDLSEAEFAACVVRRERDTERLAGLPLVTPVVTLDVPDDPTLVTELMNLPPPLPARDAGTAGALIARGLIHQWASSEAALGSAVRRRLARATALTAALQAGRYPSSEELEAWTYADGAIQLGFADLLAPSTPDAGELLDSIAAHAGALDKLLTRCRTTSLVDEARAARLQEICDENPNAKIVAFAQYSATISELYRRLVRKARVAMLTASGAQVAGGKLSRQDAIERFAPHANHSRIPSRAETIDVLLATDLLSEGVNLQDAEIVVHLDFPWTAARLEQRVGRVARMGSRHPNVRVFQLRPPASAEEVLRGHLLINRKWELARKLVGANLTPISRIDPVDRSISSIPSRTERLRTVLSGWRGTAPSQTGDPKIFAAAVSASENGFIAAGHAGRVPVLLCCSGHRISTDLEAQITACGLAQGRPVDLQRFQYTHVCSAIEQWADWNSASESAGAAVTPPSRRKRLLNRIDAALQNAPPHVRAARAGVAARAREIATATHGAALEQELEEFTDLALPDDDWLNALGNLATPRRDTAHNASGGFQLRALLVLRR
jgi:hypothetical protein